MRILLISDVHANRAALEAIAEPHDACLCVGDLVDYGLEPAPVIDWVHAHVQACVRGNHDHMVAQDVRTNGQTGFRYLSGVTRSESRRRLDAGRLRFLAELPVTRTLTLLKRKFLLVHATPRDPLDEYASADVEFWRRRLEQVDADIICVGHTHQPYIVEVDGKLVVNPGSVGLPRDGDPRASYAVIEDGEVTLKRIEYPVEETVRVVAESALPETAKEMLIQVYRTGALPNGVHKPAR
jgi:putative phosphoesterase